MESLFERILVNAVGRVRRATWKGREYLVAPSTLIVHGVLEGSQGALYYPEDEIRRNPREWDGMDIVAYHPTAPDGRHLSARDLPPDDERKLGFLARSTAPGEKLQSELWFDVARTANYDKRLADEYKILPRLRRNESIELSTGLFTQNHPAPPGANFRGRPYTHVARSYRPDHLAVLPDQTGACSRRDGCGVLVNQSPAGLVDAWVANLDRDSDGQFAVEGKKDDEQKPVGGKPDKKKAKLDAAAAGTAEARTRMEQYAGNGVPRSTATGRWKPTGSGTGRGPAHESAQSGAAFLTDEDRARGEDARDQLINYGADRPSWAADEDKWSKAQVAGTNPLVADGDRWAVTAHVYRKLGGLILNANPEGCNQYKSCGEAAASVSKVEKARAAIEKARDLIEKAKEAREAVRGKFTEMRDQAQEHQDEADRHAGIMTEAMNNVAWDSDAEGHQTYNDLEEAVREAPESSYEDGRTHKERMDHLDKIKDLASRAMKVDLNATATEQDHEGTADDQRWSHFQKENQKHLAEVFRSAEQMKGQLRARRSVRKEMKALKDAYTINELVDRWAGIWSPTPTDYDRLVDAYMNERVGELVALWCA